VNQYVNEPPSTDRTLVFVTESIANIPRGFRARDWSTVVGRVVVAAFGNELRGDDGFGIAVSAVSKRRRPHGIT